MGCDPFSINHTPSHLRAYSAKEKPHAARCIYYTSFTDIT